MAPASVDLEYRLSDRFARDTGRVYLTGWDALVRLPLMQRQRDELAGLNTAGYVSGYPGSPLGGLDSLLRAQRQMLADRHIHFEPGLNEDIAATAVAGTQNLNVPSLSPVQSKYHGVFAMWYGKGPGVERSTDAIRTANFRGVPAHGGVLALAGDDHLARSTVTAQQSETLFVHMHIPVLNPATIQDYLDFGLAGWALSRFSSSWVAMICLNDTVDSAATVDVDPGRPSLVLPDDVARPLPYGTARAGGLGGSLAIDKEIRTLRYPAAQAFVRINGLDRVALPSKRSGINRGLGIVAAGKSYLDVEEGLAQLGISRDRAREIGISIYKPAMTFPLDPVGVLEFVDGLDEVLIVEPKHPLIEDQLVRYLRRLPRERQPVVVGKTDERGEPLVPEFGGLDASIVSEVLLNRLAHLGHEELAAPLRPRQTVGVISPISEDADHDEPAPSLVRSAGFCSGCPHNTSTRIPDGSLAIGGTGCYGMAGMYRGTGRDTYLGTHMGGEGALWIGMFPFTDRSHTFQNMGDGTYAHSGSLVIRAAIAAGVNMTFKILLNGYISMTGGQALPGDLTAQMIARELLGEGVRKVVVVSDDVAKYRGQDHFPNGVDVLDRADLLRVQEDLRQIEGVTGLIYDQACAAELRRERKRGKALDPDKRVFIHEEVCEGCGDCNVQSNCISVEPLDTAFGRKRHINQSTCNKDFSCVSGYCPSFVTLYGAKPRRRGKATVGRGGQEELFGELSPPAVVDVTEPYNILVGGIGGGGVLTIGALLGMAAHLEGKTATVLNESGLAQKNGAVQSHVRVIADGAASLGPRINPGSTDLVLGADIVVVASSGPVSTMLAGRTSAIVNDDVRPTVGFTLNADMDLSAGPLARVLRRATGDRAQFIPANHLAEELMGDAIYANLFLMGYAAQRGQLPVSVAAIERAIELNAVEVGNNLEALNWGRLAAHDIHRVSAIVKGDVPFHDPRPETLGDVIAERRDILTRYQDAAYAERYETAVRAIVKAERGLGSTEQELSLAVARNLFKLMAYKDEYEVARLYTDEAFRRRLDEEFEPGYSFKVNLAPQLLNKRDPRTGRAKKWEVPSAIAMPAFRVLAHGRRLRGTRFDVFGQSEHRKAERARIDEYLALVRDIADRLDEGNHKLAVQLANLPDTVRGYDTIKDASAKEAKEKEAILLEEFGARSARV